MKRRRPSQGLPAIDLIEEVVHRLRRTPLSRLLLYYAGTAPFVLGLLYFWTDMSCGAFAEFRCPAAAWGMAALFLWMKCWQAAFAAALRAGIAGRPLPPWNFRRAGGLLATQAILQPSKLFLLPLAAILTLPFGWVLAFYENVTALAADEEDGAKGLFRRAAEQAQLWPRQNHAVLLILGLLGLVVWLNVFTALALLPQLLKMLLGIETVFTRGGIWSLFNTTYLAATVALAYLAVDPLVKTVYALRCFHGEARKSGADLLAVLAAVRPKSPVLAVLAALFLGLQPVAAENRAAPPAAETASVSSAELDQAIRTTLAQDKYAWRLPRVEAPESEGVVKGWLRGLVRGVADTTLKWLRAIRDGWRELGEWFRDVFGVKGGPLPGDGDGSGGGSMTALQGFAFVLLALAAAALGVLLWRVIRHRRLKPAAVLAEVLPAKPDLADENVTASQLPEDGWLKLAGELIARGDLRLALRALYLAGLAHLAAREVVRIARFKSNRDYESEVRRRARGQPELCAAFSENVAMFDRVWYGPHDVTVEALGRFQSNLERIRAC